MHPYASRLTLLLCCYLSSFTTALTAPVIANVTPHTVYYGKGGEVTVTLHDAKSGEHLTISPGGSVLQASLELPASAHDIAVGQDVAVIAAGAEGALIVDLTTFQIIGIYHDGNEYTHVAVQGDQALLTTDHGRLIQIDIHDHDHPRLMYSIETDATISAMSWRGNRAYLLLDKNNLQTVEVSKSTKPRPLIRQRIKYPAFSLASDGKSVFLAEGDNGLAILDGNSGKLISRYQTTGPALDVAIQKGLAFIAQGDSGLVILDIRNPGKPVWIGSHGKLGNVKQVEVKYDRVLLGNERGQLSMIDVGRPEMPTTFDSYSLHSAISAIALPGHESLVASGRHLQKIDFSNQAPQISNEGLDVGRGVNFGGERRAYIDGKVAYVADWFSGIHLYDISRPDHPTLLSSFHTPGSSKGITVHDGIAYVADDDHGLEIIDVHNPLQPKLISNLPTPGLAYIPKLVGDTLYLAGHRGGLQIIDVHDPTKPHLLTTVETPGMAWGIAVENKKAYVADDQGGLLVIDVGDPQHARLLGQFNPGGRAEDVLIRDEIAYMSFFDQGLYIVDVHDPTKPRQLAHLPTPGNARGIAVKKDHLYLADWLAGVEVIDIHNPSQPRLVGSYDTPGAAWGINVKGNYVYVSDWWGGFLVLNVTKPEHPVLAGRYHERGRVEQIAARDNFLFTANGSGGLQIFDNRNALNPTWITGVDTTHPADHIMLSKDTAFVGEDNGTVTLVNIKNPFEAYDIGELDLPASASAMAAKGNMAYFAVHKLGIVIADVGTPRWPKEIARYITPVADMYLHGDTLYVLTPDSVIKQLDVSNPGHPILHRQDILSGESSMMRVLGDALVIYQPQRGLLALRIAGDGIMPMASYPFKGTVTDMTVADGNLYVTVEDDGVYLFKLESKDFSLQAHYSLSSRVTRATVHNGTVYIAGESAITALAPLNGITIAQKVPDKLNIKFPANSPLGSYNLELTDSDGNTSVIPNAVRVRMPSFNRPNITPEEFEKLLKEQRAKNRIHPPSGQ